MKKILSFIGILTSIVSAGNITLMGNIEPASIVGFDSGAVQNGNYTDYAIKHNFLGSDLEVELRLGERFLLEKNLYVKSNSTGGLKMAMSANYTGGRLENIDGDTISVDYYLNANKVTMNGSDYKTLYSSNSTPNQVVTLTNAFKAQQKNSTSADQGVGDYTTTITVSLSAI